ncbi:hypothetical protein FJZ22_00915 [Candidatus Pacearchaeota archaeon]|nr:hypothetical protein [Candidatus Pacearchaeota archaeon]
MNFLYWFKEWRAKSKAASEADERRYQEELQAEACQLLSENAAELRHETDLLTRLRESDQFTLGLPQQFSNEKDNPWLKPPYIIERNNVLFGKYHHIRNNQSYFEQRAGSGLMEAYLQAYQEFSEARDKLIKAEA